MPWIEALTDVRDLRRCIRDLVAISTLPANWKEHDPHQVADGVAAALRLMLKLELIHISMCAGAEDPPIEITHSANPLAENALAEMRGALSSGGSACLTRHGSISAVQSTYGDLRIASITIGFGGDAMIIAASRQPDFPTEPQRLILGVGANEAAIALHRWRAETNHQRFVSLADTSADFIGFATLDGHPLYLNAAGCRLVGLSGLEEACCHHVLDYVMPAERERAWRVMSIVLKQGRWRGEINFRHFETGAAIPFFVDWFRIDDPNTGKPMNMATVSRDLTADKLAESEQRRLNESLERRVLERTTALADANCKLVTEIAKRARADAKLEKLQSELFHATRLSAAGQMATALAHELNQPLTAAANYVNTARRLLANGGNGQANNPIRHMLDEASNEVVRTGQIILRLREFLASGTTEKRLENVKQIVEEASALALSGHTALDVKVMFGFKGNTAMAVVDRIQIQQVIANLIRNAIEAMAKSERRELAVTVAMQDKSTVEVSVADTGMGVQKEVADHLFEPFVSTKRGGMGIGLSICRSIIESHGGNLRSEPKQDGGAIFRFTLPAVPRQGAANAE
jgi:PAS domain S-box-containing protein